LAGRATGTVANGGVDNEIAADNHATPVCDTPAPSKRKKPPEIRFVRPGAARDPTQDCHSRVVRTRS
jgi:hypothetical protein